jgi:translation initiation factor IF-2
MAKKDDAGSGLRAGFIRSDGPPQPPKKKKPEGSEQKVAAPTLPPAETKPADPKEVTGPTITMRGVSGKKITGAVKVIKAAKAAKPVEKKTDPESEKKVDVEVASIPEDSKQDIPAAKGKAVKDPKAPKVAQPAEVAEVDVKPKKTVAKTKVQPEAEQPAEPPRSQPRSHVSPGQTGPRPRRPQSGLGDLPQSQRAPGQGGSFTPRSQSDHPQSSRQPSGRDVSARDGAPVGRPSSSRPPRLKIPDIPEELIEKLPDSPRARDSFGRDGKRDERREPRKETGRTAADTRDKHRAFRQQAQAMSGRGVNAALSDEALLETFYRDSGKGRGRGGRSRRSPKPAPVVRAVLTHVVLPETLTVKEFAEAIKKTSAEVIKKLIKLGIMATVNQQIDFDTATIVAEEFDITTEKLIEVTEEEILFDESEDLEADLKPRPPVVVVMGHVDHGKTSILDRIRSASVVEDEAGGITQHIGAYTVQVKGRQITFLDTPGHEAFTTMRARGAQVTDVAILVVAADDGVMPQTIEAINHAKAADIQIIVAINKIDKADINIDRVKQELATHDLIPEEWGGTTVMVPVSAKTGQGMDELLEMVLLTADILDLKANPDKQAKGTVIEAQLDRNRGPVATVLVQRGTLSIGDTLVVGSIIGNVRAMANDKGSQVKSAGPSIPVEILGMPEVPEAGEIFYAVTDDKVARALAERRRTEQREQQLRSSSRMSLDTLFTQIAAGEVKDFNIIVKADVQGSVEAVRQALEKLTSPEVRINIIHGAVGAITESDVRLAEVSNAIVIGFNVRPAANVADMAKETGVDLRMYRVIYHAIEDIEAAMKGLLAPQFEETILGHAEVRQVFRVSGVGSVAGCYVTDGKIHRSSEVRIVRDGIVVHEGKLASLRRFKDDVREVAAGYECGMGIERFNDIKENDIIEAFEMTEIERG